MADVKITYFNIKGRAEMARLVMAAAGKEFQDIRYQKGEWDAGAKDKTPFGQSPTLEVGGKVYGQSMAIATYLARENGLAGKNNLEALAVDQYVQLVQDCINCAVKAIREKDADKKAEFWKKFQEEDTPKYWAWFDKAVADNKTGYMVGDSLTLADIAVFDLVTGMLDERVCSTDNYPNLKALVAKVGETKGIKEWVAKRA